MYQDVQLFIDGSWVAGAAGRTIAVENPASGESLGTVARAEIQDLDRALAAAQTAFESWRDTSAFERCQVMRKAANIFRERAGAVAELMTQEQGKPAAEAKAEALAGADLIDWFAEEGRRTYGRTIPSRAIGISQMEIKEPVGPVAAFTPWNFPINQAVRKVGPALAAGCSIIVKGPEETPASCAALIAAFADAGLPKGVLNLVYGDPAEISEYLIPHPVIRKVSFTGSTPVGKRLASLAGTYMKRVTMELGGHAPALICADADVDLAAQILSSNKFRNAGQTCVSPTRFLVHVSVYRQFVERFVAHAQKIKVGDGLQPSHQMGPLANSRRLRAMETLIADAVGKGAKIAAGGQRIGVIGCFFQPTVLLEVPEQARVMNEEPFGPLALINTFSEIRSAIREANRLPYGLAAYVYTRSGETASLISRSLESGMISINHHGLGRPEVPFGGIKDSGYGTEGGADALDAYLNTKYITQMMAG
jgi:succinate-semialdehyde dehydrogenase / glutarate-semialdehyde dehydrogenase